MLSGLVSLLRPWARFVNCWVCPWRQAQVVNQAADGASWVGDRAIKGEESAIAIQRRPTALATDVGGSKRAVDCHSLGILRFYYGEGYGHQSARRTGRRSNSA